jgi:hypothetical protein
MIPDIFNSPCVSCKNLITFDLPTGQYNPFAKYTPICSAFKDGIPKEILTGKNRHTVKLDTQDNDIIYSQIENENENRDKWTKGKPVF